MRSVESFYMKAVKALLLLLLLGVRITTPTNLCLIEAGIQPIKGIVKNRQKKFLNNIMSSRAHLDEEDPLMHILKRTREVMWAYIQSNIKGDEFVIDELNA